jgi:diguanylate cyclase (GGDEF)-like protein
MAFSLSHTVFIVGLNYHLFMIYSGDYKNIFFIIFQIIMFSFSTPLTIHFINQKLKKITLSFHSNKQKSSFLLPILIFLFVYISRFFISFTSFYVLFIYYIVLLLIVILSYSLISNLITGMNHIDKLSIKLHIDPLTKLKNRLALFNDYLTYQKEYDDFNLYFLDLNHLKHINDQFGHQVGDEYLIAFSKSLDKVMNHSKYIYRISGDEFIILSTALFKNLDSLKFKISQSFSSKTQFLGVSIGVSHYSVDGSSLDKLLQIADERMYIDKKRPH